MNSVERNVSSEYPNLTWKEHLENRWNHLEYLRPDLAENPVVGDMKKWIEKRTKELPEMRVKPSSLTESEPEDANIPHWIAIAAPDNQIIEIKRSDDTFFALQGRRIQVYTEGELKTEWVQPIIAAKEKPTNIPTPDGQVELPIHGYLGVLTDTENRVLLTVSQEVESENENHADVVLAIQASVSKIALIKEGDPKADKNLAALLEKLSGGDISKLLDKPDAIVPAPAEDPNREIKHNLYLFPGPIEVGSEFHQKLVASGIYRWCTQEEIDALALTRLTNAHTLSALRTWEALKRGHK